MFLRYRSYAEKNSTPTMRATIDLYIKSVLQEVDSLALPGVGTLRKVVTPARIDEGSGRIYPPQVELRFESKVDKTVLISDQLVDFLHMPREESQAVEIEIVRGLKNHFRQEGSYRLQGVGTLRQNDDGAITFLQESSHWNDLAGDFFGLLPVGLPHDSPLPSERPHTENQLPMKQFSAQPTRRNRGIGWKTALLILLLPTLGALLASDWLVMRRSSLGSKAKIAFAPAEEAPSLNTGLSDEISTILVPEDIQESATRSLDSVATPAASDAAEIVEENPAAEESSSLATSEPATNTDVNSAVEEDAELEAEDEQLTHLNDLQSDQGLSSTFKAQARLASPEQRSRGMEEAEIHYLIVASFSQEKGANQRAEELREKGYNTAILVSPKGESVTYRVAIFRSNNRAQVEAYVKEIKGRGFNAPWIFSLGQ